MYPSDCTEAQWTRLEPLLKKPRGQRHAGGRPRKYELRRVVDALLYGMKTGCRTAICMKEMVGTRRLELLTSTVSR